MQMVTSYHRELVQNHTSQRLLMTGHHMVVDLHLNLLISCTLSIRCLQPISTFFLIYGQHLYLKQAGTLCSLTTNRCTIQLTALSLETSSCSSSLSNILETQELTLCLGCMIIMMFGFRIPVKLCTTCWQILTLLMKWTINHSMSTI